MKTSDSVSRRSRNHRRLLKWFKRGAYASVGLGLAAGLAYAWMPKPVPVETGRAARGPLQVSVQEYGRTRVRQKFVVHAPLSGNLLRIELEPGDAVEAGQIVGTMMPPPPAMLDDRSRSEAQTRLSAAEARRRQSDTAVARAEAALAHATRSAERTRDLAARGTVSQTELDQAELSERMAAEDLAHAQLQRRVATADVEMAKSALGTLKRGKGEEVGIAAPAPGQILRILRESEGPVSAGTPLLEIGDPTQLEVVVDVLSRDSVAIRPGAPVVIEEWGGPSVVTGRVRRVEPSAFTRVSALGVEEQRINVLVAIDDAPRGLGDGFRVEARISTWEAQEVLSVPESAVFRRGDGWGVYVVQDGVVRTRTIQVGRRGRLAVQVLEGLEPGERVVLYPDDRLTDGVAVAPVSEPA